MVLAARAEPAGRDRLPEEPGRARSDERRALRGHPGAAPRARHPSSLEEPPQPRDRGVSHTSPRVAVARAAPRRARRGGAARRSRRHGDRRPARDERGRRGTDERAAPGGWNVAFAGSRGATGDAQRTTCGQVLTPESLGVTHPVLPCGAKVVLRSGYKQVLTEVIDNKLAEPGRAARGHRRAREDARHRGHESSSSGASRPSGSG